MARIALLPEFTLPRSLDDLRERLVAHEEVTECTVVVHEARTADPVVYNAELAERLGALAPLDLVVATGSTADGALAGRGEAHVLLIDPPLSDIAPGMREPGSLPTPMNVAPDHAEMFDVVIASALGEAEQSGDPLAVRRATEWSEYLRDRLPFQAVEVAPVPWLQWALDAYDGADHLSIWLTRTCIDATVELLRFRARSEWANLRGPDGEAVTFDTVESLIREDGPAWYAPVDWPRHWWWAAPQAAADAIVALLA